MKNPAAAAAQDQASRRIDSRQPSQWTTASATPIIENAMKMA
jgi:hypothetical protein